MTAAVLVAVSLVVAVSAFASPAQQQKTLVGVTAGKPSEFRFTLSRRTVVKGITTFTVTNKGTTAHDFKIAGKKTVRIAPGRTKPLTVTFTKVGKFPYLCTLPGHAAGGMKGTLTVRNP